jgi:hypothetical protein
MQKVKCSESASQPLETFGLLLVWICQSSHVVQIINTLGPPTLWLIGKCPSEAMYPAFALTETNNGMYCHV